MTYNLEFNNNWTNTGDGLGRGQGVEGRRRRIVRQESSRQYGEDGGNASDPNKELKDALHPRRHPNSDKIHWYAGQKNVNDMIKGVSQHHDGSFTASVGSAHGDFKKTFQPHHIKRHVL